MSGQLTLTPLGEDTRSSAPPGGYATLSQVVVERLARAIPDAQSAVLVLLTWNAVRNSRLKRGPLAGRVVASLSGAQLGRLTGRPLRTIRYALRQLAARGQVVREVVPAGRKGVYSLPFLVDPSTRAPPASEMDEHSHDAPN